jgi:hypothetical protein
MVPWAISLKTHNILYKVFPYESFGKYLSYVDSFVKSYCVFYSKLIWSHDNILSEDESVASNLWSDFVSNIFDPP